MLQREPSGSGPVDEQLLRAQALHAAGRVEEAAALYLAILTRDPGCVDAAHALGVAALDAGRVEGAAPLIEQAARLAPERADVLATVGLLRRRQGRRAESVEALQRAAALAPADAEIALSLGVALQESGARADAIAAYRRALALDPGHAGAWSNLAAALTQDAQHAEAVAAAERAVALAPAQAPGFVNLCRALIGTERHADAVAPGRRARALAPASTAAARALAEALHRSGQSAEAESVLRAAHGQAPSDVEVLFDLATLLQDLERPEEAVPFYRRLLQQAPSHGEAIGNLANALQTIGALDEAMTAYRLAEAAAPGNAQIAFNRALGHLLRGDLAEGFARYEARWGTPRFQAIKRSFACPRWTGGPVAGGALLLHGEQGLGDQIMFARYAAAVAARCRPARIVVEVDERLVRLLATLAGLDPAHGDAVVAFGTPVPDLAAEAPLMSLPAIVGTALGTIPAAIPYLAAPAGSWAFHPPALRHAGIAWAGSPTHRQDHRRSLALAALAPLFSLSHTIWHSLQLGPAADQLAEPGAPIIVDHRRRLVDMAETAGLIQALDYVVSVDTAVAHLAGALARPVYVLVPTPPDWRWLLGREDSPWYPTMRLVRQSRRGDWATPVAALAARLAREFPPR